MLNNGWPESQRKRVREDEYADVAAGGTLGFTEHRTKRLQALPLRSSPTSKRVADPPNFPPPNPYYAPPVPPRTITPGASDSEESGAVEQQIWASEPELISQQPSPWAAITDSAHDDMDMEGCEPTPSYHENSWQPQNQPEQQQHLEPGSFQPDPTAPTITGRMPTPIHCSFAQQVKGNNWNGAAGNGMSNSPVDNANIDAFNRSSLLSQGGMPQPVGMTGYESVPRSLDGPAATAQVMADWSMVQNRRLPSPISESGGEDSLESPRMVLDSSSQQMGGGHLGHLTHQHPMLSSLPANRSCSASELNGSPSPTHQHGFDSPGNRSAMETESPCQSSPATPSPGRKGHVRSKHTVNSWTALQPGMKRSFSIGYRADCEKCRMKVPGHFNHIIIS